MKRRSGQLALVAAVVAVISACAAAVRSPEIADIQHNPGRYQDHTVAINGVVTSSWGLPLVPFRVYRVDDGTGEMTVLSESSSMPAPGAHVRVKGKVNEVGQLGGQALGLHLREETLSIKH
ncbi:MAG TPA: hypothetical protein VMS04_23420 [Vicinamibacterales bacterium]|nr:hypothetical protein [Vicinamibacterales bacterium]